MTVASGIFDTLVIVFERFVNIIIVRSFHLIPLLKVWPSFGIFFGKNTWPNIVNPFSRDSGDFYPA